MFDGLNDLYIGIDLDVSRYRVYRREYINHSNYTLSIEEWRCTAA